MLSVAHSCSWLIYLGFYHSFRDTVEIIWFHIWQSTPQVSWTQPPLHNIPLFLSYLRPQRRRALYCRPTFVLCRQLSTKHALTCNTVLNVEKCSWTLKWNTTDHSCCIYGPPVIAAAVFKFNKWKLVPYLRQPIMAGTVFKVNILLRLVLYLRSTDHVWCRIYCLPIMAGAVSKVSQ